MQEGGFFVMFIGLKAYALLGSLVALIKPST